MKKEKMSGHMNKLIRKICIIFGVSFAGMFALLCFFVSIRGSNPFKGLDYDAELTSDTEDTTQQQNDSSEDADGATEEESLSEGEKLAQEWGLRISSREKMDFHRVLLEEDYRQFDGHAANENLDESFSFAYPKNLYYSVEAEADDVAGRYSVSFRGNDNSALLSYSQQRHGEDEEETPMEEMYEEDMDALTDAETLLHLDTVYVVTGYEDNGSLEVYKVVKADEDNLYTMVIKTPVPEKEDARTLVSFYTEYLYRSCGFSGSSKEPRSYVEFLRGDE